MRADNEIYLAPATPQEMPEEVPAEDGWTVFGVSQDEAGVSHVAPLSKVAAAA